MACELFDGPCSECTEVECPEPKAARTKKMNRLKAKGQTLAMKASGNMEKWGDQDYETIALAIAEEAGEVAQAILQHKYEGGFEDRIYEEAIDLGALCIQMMMKF